MMNCISRNRISGFPNQKSPSRGFTWAPAVVPVCCSLTSSASFETTCSSLVPTSMTSLNNKTNTNTCSECQCHMNFKSSTSLLLLCSLTMAGMNDNQKYIFRPETISMTKLKCDDGNGVYFVFYINVWVTMNIYADTYYSVNPKRPAVDLSRNIHHY